MKKNNSNDKVRNRDDFATGKIISMPVTLRKVSKREEVPVTIAEMKLAFTTIHGCLRLKIIRDKD
jgi:hypothetical protein